MIDFHLTYEQYDTLLDALESAASNSPVERLQKYYYALAEVLREQYAAQKQAAK